MTTPLLSGLLRRRAHARWVTAGGVLFTALQDGRVVAYDDEKLAEPWRFNVGTPLKGAPVSYAIGPKHFSWPDARSFIGT